MSGWKECKLGEVAEIIGGGTPKTEIKDYWNGNIPWVTPRDLSGYSKRTISRGERNISELGLSNSNAKLLPKGTVLLSSRAPIGYLAIAENEISTNQGFQSLVPDKTVSSIFLYYLLKSNVDYLISQGEGTTFGELAKRTVKEISFLFPPLAEQKAIASILSSLDDKIDLLHQQNKTLEGMAEALWRKMFVKEANPKWEESSLLEIIDLVGGGTPKTEVSEYWNGSIPWLSARDITSNHKSFIVQTEKNITELGLKNSSAKILPRHATIISARGTVGNYCILSSPMAFSQSNYGVLPKIDGCYFFTYLLIAHIVGELKSAAYGSVFDTITTNTFREQKITLPSEDKILSFEKMINTYFEKIYSNTAQIRTLSRLRDTLLPKLMSGEVRVRL